MPASTALATGNAELIERFGNLRGCWIAILADRGSDAIDHEGFELAAGSRQSEGSLQAVMGPAEIVLDRGLVGLDSPVPRSPNAP